MPGVKELKCVRGEGVNPLYNALTEAVSQQSITMISFFPRFCITGQWIHSDSLPYRIEAIDIIIDPVGVIIQACVNSTVRLHSAARYLFLPFLDFVWLDFEKRWVSMVLTFQILPGKIN